MTSDTTLPTTNTSEYFYGLLTVLLSVFIIVTIYFVTQYSKARTRISVEDVIGKPLPAGYVLVNSFKTVGGKILELSNPAGGYNLKIAIADEPMSSLNLQANENLVQILLDYQRDSKLASNLIPELLIKYGAAQFDYRRVSNFQKLPLETSNTLVTVHTFLSSKKIFYGMLVHASKVGPTFFLVERPNQEMDTKVISEFLTYLNS